nr:immunoglobulin light chain junction region [Macaca mulatta]
CSACDSSLSTLF